jgi:protein ImuB
MFACLYLPPPARPVPARGEGEGGRGEGQGARGNLHADLLQLARDFSPRVETHGDGLVSLDVDGLGSLLGDARAIGEELRRTAADRGLRVHIAVAATSTAAILLAHARAGLTVVPAGAEAATLAPLPLSALAHLDFGLRASDSRHEAGSQEPEANQLKRWGLKTLGDLAAIPAADLSARLGQDGLMWQRWARGEDARPLVPAGVEDRFEDAIDLEWPIDGLEPLSFVLARLFEPLCDRLERHDRGAVALHVTLTLVTREMHARTVRLPAPMRDARVLRTLALLDLDTNPPPAAVDRVAVAVDVTEGRVLQFGLFARALPAEKLATLLARLRALMGSDRAGAPALVDSYRPGAFAMGHFEPSRTPGPKDPQSSIANGPSPTPNPQSLIPSSVIRRFRAPIPARVTLEHGRPVRLTTDRRGLSGGRVERCDGPWRSSGEWWVQPWNCDEWDVALSDGGVYRISQALDHRGGWFVNGLLD